MVQASPLSCDSCHGPHPTKECHMVNPMGELTIEQAHYLSKFPLTQEYNTYAQNYNPSWKNHPNFSWRNQNVVNPMEQVKPPLPPQEKKSSLGEKIEQLAEMQMEMKNSIQQFENETRASFNNQATQLRNLEVQMGQMASLLNERQQDNLPSTSEVNPRREGIEL